MELELREYLSIHVSSWTSVTLDPKRFGGFTYSTPLTPLQYLTFAEKDLRLGGPRGLVNALANTKRAIDCHIYSLLSSLGILEQYSFPGRLETLRALGLVAPRIIRKIVQLRNILEHEYHLPSSSEVEDALDVASLFVASLKPYFAGGAYMETAWVADDTSANPRTEIVLTRSLAVWRGNAGPEFTFSRGIYIDSGIGNARIELDLIHDNVNVGVALIAPRDPAYIELQGLLLRASIENFAHTRRGAKRFIKALHATAA